MKIAIAQIWQETNTFSRIPTGLREFEQGGLFSGDEIPEKMQGLGEIGGFMDALKGEVLAPILRAWAMSGGRVTAEALESFKDRLVEGTRGEPAAGRGAALDARRFSQREGR